MIWLLSQLWPIGLISLIAGFAITWFSVVRRRPMALADEPAAEREHEETTGGPGRSVGTPLAARTEVPETTADEREPDTRESTGRESERTDAEPHRAAPTALAASAAAAHDDDARAERPHRDEEFRAPERAPDPTMSR